MQVIRKLISDLQFESLNTNRISTEKPGYNRAFLMQTISRMYLVNHDCFSHACKKNVVFLMDMHAYIIIEFFEPMIKRLV